MFSTRSLTIIHKYLIKYFNKKSIYILKLFFFICLISLFTPIYSSAETKFELHPDGYPAIDEYNRHIVDLTQINDVSSITHDQGNTIDHPDYIIKLPDNGLTINNNDEGDSVISFMAHAENKFSILFDGDLTINKTGALITNNAGISINTEAESGVYTIDGNLIINLNNIGVNKYTGALNAFAGDFNVTGDTTVSVDNLSNLRTYSNLDFAGITIGGGADIQNAQEKNYTFNNITINKINAISNASVTDSNLAKVYGLYLDSYAYDSDTFNDMELDRTFTAADLTIESISLTAQNPYDAFSAGRMNNGVTAQLDSLYIDGITVNAKGSAESYGVMIKPGTEKQASLVVDELATVSNIHAFSDTDATPPVYRSRKGHQPHSTAVLSSTTSPLRENIPKPFPCLPIMKEKSQHCRATIMSISRAISAPSITAPLLLSTLHFLHPALLSRG